MPLCYIILHYGVSKAWNVLQLDTERIIVIHMLTFNREQLEIILVKICITTSEISQLFLCLLSILQQKTNPTDFIFTAK
jgi:hypothetical protein